MYILTMNSIFLLYVLYYYHMCYIITECVISLPHMCYIITVCVILLSYVLFELWWISSIIYCECMCLD